MANGMLQASGYAAMLPSMKIKLNRHAVVIAGIAACILLSAAAVFKFVLPQRRVLNYGFGDSLSSFSFLNDCPMQAVSSMMLGYLQPGLDHLETCKKQDVADARLKEYLARIDSAREEFKDITGNWRPEFKTLFLNEDGLNPQLGEDKIERIDGFVKKYPGSYHSQLLTFAKAGYFISNARYEDAVRLLKRNPSMPAIGGYAEYMKAYAMLKQGDIKGVRELFEGFSKDSPGNPMRHEIGLLLAEGMFQAGDAGAAEELCRSIADGAEAPYAKLHAYDELTKIYMKDMNAEKVSEAFRQAAADPDLAGLKDLGFLMSERLGMLNVPSKYSVPIARFFISQDRYYDAYNALGRNPLPAATPEASLLNGIVLFRMGRAKEALRNLDAAASQPASEETKRSACVWRGRIFLGSNLAAEVKKGESILKGCIVNYKSGSGEAIQQMLKLYDAQENDPAAAGLLEILYAYNPEYDEGLLERYARMKLAAGKRAAAFDAFKLLSEKYPQGRFTDEALFWMAKIEMGMGRTETALPLLMKLRREFPYSYYYFRAGELINKAGGDAVSSKYDATVGFPRVRSEHVKNGYAFMELGYNGLAAYEFNNALLEDDDAVADAAGVGLARLRLSEGDIMGSVKQIENRAYVSPRLVYLVFRIDSYRSLLFPEMYGDVLKKASSRNRLPAEFAFGIVRQESRFDANATSRSNAKGLMQIIPSTGAWIAGKKAVAGFETSQLYDPVLNTDFGTWYARYVLDKFSGDIRLAAAAYNGGPGNVSRWLKRFGYSDQDVFVERIPRGETRDYVKKVTFNYYVYKTILNR